MFLFAQRQIFIKLKFLKLQKIILEEFIAGREIQAAIIN